MKSFSEYTDKQLRLVATSFLGLDYDLVSEKESISSFSCDRTFSFNGIVNGFGKSIEFYKPFILKGDINIREIGRENPFAVYKREIGFYTGIIELSKGNRVRIKLGFFYLNVTIENLNGKTLILLKRSNIFSRKINVVIKEKTPLLEENPWIIFLALYLSIKGMMRRL